MQTLHTRALPLLVTLFVAAEACAQLPAGRPAPGPSPNAPAVGAMAPDFTVTGATRFGLLAAPVRLSDLRGKTVVLAFFYRARTKG